MSKLIKVVALMALVGTVMVSAPATSKAVTIDELMAQIAALQAQLAALQGNSAPVSSCSFADASAPNLTVGSRGANVSALQAFLKVSPVTGYFGPLTKAAVVAFQKAHNISPAAGYFGPLTKAAVRPLCVAPSASPSASPVVSGTPVPSVVGALSVSLASDSPAAASVPASGALVPFTKVVFTATGGQVVVDSLTVQRLGLSRDTDFSGIVLIDPQGNQIGYAKTLGSTHQAVFDDDLTIPAGQSATYTIAGNIAGTVAAGDIASLSLVSVVTKDGASVGGSLPITGSSMTMVNVTIGTVTVTKGGLNPGDSTQRVGTTGYNLSSVNIQANTDDMKITKIRWYQDGTAADADVSNLKLKVNGVQVGATLSSATNKYATFDLSASPVVITKGLTKEFTLVGDIVGGSGRTIVFDIYDNTDISAMGTSFAFNTIPNYTNATTQPYFVANTTTVEHGAFNVSKGVLASTYVAAGATSVPIGAFVFNTQGEDIQVTSAKFTFGSFVGLNYSDITNVGLYNAAGSLVAGPVDVTSGNYTTFTDTWVIPAGTNTFTLKANIASTAATNDSFVVSLAPSTDMMTRGVSTNMTITSETSGNTSAGTITVRAGALNVSTSATPAAQTYIQGQVQAPLANFVFDATGSGEDVRISTIVVTETSDTPSNTDYTKTANLTLYDGGVALSPVMQPANPSSAATSITITFNMTTPIVVAKGTSKTIALEGDIVGNSAAQFKFGLKNATNTVSATGATTSAAITAVITENLGQFLTFSTSGSALVATDSSNPASKYIAAGATGVEVGDIRITSTSENVQLSNIVIRVAIDGHGGAHVWQDIAKAYLYDGSTKVAELVPTSSHMYFTLADNALVIPSGYTGKLVTIKLDTNAVGIGQTGVSGDVLSLSVVEGSYTFKGIASGTELAASAISGTYTGNALYFARTYPSISPRLATGTTMGSGVKDLYKFSVSAPSYGDVALAKMSFLVSTYTPNKSEYTGASTTVSSFNLYDDLGNALFLTATSGRAYVDYVAGSTSGTTQLVNAAVFTGSNFSGAASHIYIVTAGTTRTFTLKGTVSNPQVGSSVTTVLVGDSAMPAKYPAPAFAGGINGGSSDLTLSHGPDNAFIWSDLWDGSATSTTLTGNRWFNGYRLSGLVASDTGSSF